MMFMGKPIEYWVELQAMVDAMAIPDTIENNIKLLRVARIARELDDKGMIIHVPKVMGTHDTTTPYLEFRYALQEVEHLLGVDK